MRRWLWAFPIYPAPVEASCDLLRTRLDTDSYTIAAALPASAVDVELAKLDRLGALASALFARLVADEQDDGRGARGFFGGDLLQSLSESLGRPVSSDDVTAALRAMTGENLVMRLDHGRYGIADPVVRKLSRERHQRLESLR